MWKSKNSYLFLICASFLLVLNFWISLAWSEKLGPGLANATYLSVRIFIYFLYGFLVSGVVGNTAIATLRSMGFLVFIDQVLIKLGWMTLESRLHPEAWVDYSPGSAGVGLLLSFVLSAPFLILFSFMSFELKKWTQSWRKTRA